MQWEVMMNRAMDYIDEHLTDKIDYEIVARVAACSKWEFSRAFSMAASVSVAEYVRGRRMILAAADLKNGEKVIDVAVKYGYESSTAFSRAFRRFHQMSPTEARTHHGLLNGVPKIVFKASAEKEQNGKTVGVIGAVAVDRVVTEGADVQQIHRTNRNFWDGCGEEQLGRITLPQWGAFLHEKTCGFLRDLRGKRVLEIACGDGRSLCWCAKQGAAELWGIDLSETQLAQARENLQRAKCPAVLLQTAMETLEGVPERYFDAVFSVYGVGWTTDLTATFRRIAAALKPGGTFQFSWSHPFHKCTSYQSGSLTVHKSYHDESWYSLRMPGGEVCMRDRTMSSYINALIEAGFSVERVIEDAGDISKDNTSLFAEKARIIPITLAIQARKC